MISIFYIAAVVLILASFNVITSVKPLHALLYLVISLLALAAIFMVLGAHFTAVLVVILFIGAIAILFIGSISMLNFTKQAAKQEAMSLTPKVWLGPLILAFLLLVGMLYGLSELYDQEQLKTIDTTPVMAMHKMLLGPYVLVIELAILLLLGAGVVAYHFAHKIILQWSRTEPSADKTLPQEEQQ